MPVSVNTKQILRMRNILRGLWRNNFGDDFDSLDVIGVRFVENAQICAVRPDILGQQRERDAVRILGILEAARVLADFYP